MHTLKVEICSAEVMLFLFIFFYIISLFDVVFIISVICIQYYAP